MVGQMLDAHYTPISFFNSKHFNTNMDFEYCIKDSYSNFSIFHLNKGKNFRKYLTKNF